MAIRRWRIPETDQEQITGLSGETGLPGLLCSVLWARGLRDAQAVRAFLEASAELDSPYDMMDMDKAVVRIRAAMEEGERIAVYGDYDCDGITSTALLTSYFQSVGADVIYYVPSREKEGYGLNKKAVDILHRQKTGLIVTVDNGISAHEEIAYASSLGIDTVVTDHHTPRDTLPEAAAVVNPRRKDCPSRFKDLAGVGVAFKLICALEDAGAAELLEYYSDLVALGTIADVVPLVGENRVIVRHGLARMAETESPGVRALLAAAGLSGKAITGESAAFGIIPRINAAGRMGSVDDAVELLLTDDADYAAETARLLNEQNGLRKKTEEDILSDIEAMLAADPSLLTRRLLILCGRGWHHGVVGICAAKLMEKYGKPVILFSAEDGTARGSGRSLPGFSLIEAIAACSERLIRYGGHTLAAGLTLLEEDLPQFTAAMEEYAGINHPAMPVPECRVDCVLSPSELTVENMRSVSLLEPFGASNEQPLFLLPEMLVEGIYPTSDGKHLRIRFQFGNHLFYAVYFRMTERELPCGKGDRVDVVAAVSVGEWNGSPRLSVQIRDIRHCGLDQEAVLASAARYSNHLRGEYDGLRDKSEIAPGRDEIAVVYRQLKKNGPVPCCADGLYYRAVGSGVDFCRVRIALDVLLELELVERMAAGYRVRAAAGKADLSSSRILSGLTGLKPGADAPG